MSRGSRGHSLFFRRDSGDFFPCAFASLLGGGRGRRWRCRTSKRQRQTAKPCTRRRPFDFSSSSFGRHEADRPEGSPPFADTAPFARNKTNKSAYLSFAPSARCSPLFLVVGPLGSSFPHGGLEGRSFSGHESAHDAPNPHRRRITPSQTSRRPKKGRKPCGRLLRRNEPIDWMRAPIKKPALLAFTFWRFSPERMYAPRSHRGALNRNVRSRCEFVYSHSENERDRLKVKKTPYSTRAPLTARTPSSA